MLTYLLTTSSLQEVILLKDNNIEDNIGVPSHPDNFKGNGCNQSGYTRFIISIEPIRFFFLYFYNNGVWRCVEIYKSNAMEQ